MKKSILTAAVMLSAIGFTSCLSSDGENKNEATLTYGGSYCFNRVTDLQTQETFITTEPQYTFNLDYTNQLITPSMSSIKFAADGAGYAFKLPSLQVSTSSPQEYSYACSGSDIIPEGQTQAYIFNRFSFKAIERSIRTANGNYIYSPVYDISYRINNRYDVMVFPTRYDLLGTTTVPGDDPAKPFTTTQPIYSLSLDTKNQKASLAITDAKFADGHTYMKIGVLELPYTVTASGISISTEPGEKLQLRDIAGNVKDAYFSDVKIRIQVPSSKGSSISFKVNVIGLQGSTTDDIYEVHAALSYYVPSGKN